MSRILTYTGITILVLAFQLLVLNQVNIHGLLHPFIYPLIIMMLPFSVSRAALLLIGFLLGYIMDMFTGVIGLHMAAASFIAFLRPIIFEVINPKKEDIFDLPNISTQGLGWFGSYTFIMVLLHHSFYFIVEVGSLAFFQWTLLRILCSTALSAGIILLLNLLFRNNRS